MKAISIYRNAAGPDVRKAAVRHQFADVLELANLLNVIEPHARAWNPWWSPHVWGRNKRVAKDWQSSGVLCFDLDHEPTPGQHTVVTPALMEAVRENPPKSANLWHFTPRGMRILFVLKEQCTDRALYLRAAQGAQTLVQAWLESAPALGVLKNDPTVFRDLARLVYPPKGFVDGVMRNAEVFMEKWQEYAIEDLAALCPPPEAPALPVLPAPVRPVLSAGSDYKDAVAEYNALNVRDWGASGMGRCPAHPKQGSACFGRLRDSDHWCCFSSHHPEGCGRKSEDGAYFTGDAADMDAFLKGITVQELVTGRKPEAEGLSDEAAMKAIEAWAAEQKPEPAKVEFVADMPEGGRVDYIKVVGREQEAVDFAEKVLATNGCYSRGGQCVRIVNGSIVTVTRDDAPYLVGKFIQWFKLDPKGNRIPIDPTQNFSAQVVKRSEFKYLRPLEMVSAVPVLRTDGSWHAAHGYDEKTKTFFWKEQEWGSLPEKVSLDEAMEAKRKLFGVIQDFPFKADVDRSVWLAALLTPLCRRFYQGNTPMFVFSSTTPGSGKTLLVQIISFIVTGAPLPVSQLNKDPTELQKELLSALLGGVPMRMFDNVVGAVKSPPLEAVLTSGGLFTGRLLGKSRDAVLPVNTVFYMTGNNVSLDGDLFRRSVLCELAPDMESPEMRSDFHITDIWEYMRKNWMDLFKTASMLIQAWVQAGRPRRKRSVFGSFEQWSMVRDIIMWLGEVDPVRKLEAGAAGERTEAIMILLDGLDRIYGLEPFTLFQMCGRVNAACEASSESEMPAPEACVLQAAILTQSCRGQGRTLFLEPTKIGFLFRSIEGRWFGGMTLKRAGRTRENKTLWVVCRAEART